MGLFTKDIQSFDDLFTHTLQDIYYAENKILKSLPDMIANATNAQLKQGLQAHLGETKTHVQRLEQAFQMLGQSATSVSCPAIDGIIEEAEEISGEVEDKDVLDAAIIAAGQAVEHYEITRYGSLIAWAKRLGRSDIASLLEQTLKEEKAADQKLTSVAEFRSTKGQPARNRRWPAINTPATFLVATGSFDRHVHPTSAENHCFSRADVGRSIQVDTVYNGAG